MLKKQKAEKGNQQPNADRETVGEHLEHWLHAVAKPNTRRKTWASYESVVRLHLKPRIGGVPLCKLTVSQVTKLWASLGADGMSAGMVKKCSEVLATALESAVAEQKIPVAPTANAAKPRVIRGEVDVFSDDEVKRILKAADGDYFEALYSLAVSTGARQGELLCLELADFDVEAGTVRIVKSLDDGVGGFRINPPKSKSGVRTICLPAFAVEAVRRHTQGRKPGPVFTTTAAGYVCRSDFIRRDCTPLLVKAEVPYRKFHTLRHTHASRLLAEGVDPAEVAKRIGDRIETLMRVYSHWMPTANRDTAAKINAIYGGVHVPKTAPDSPVVEVAVLPC